MDASPFHHDEIAAQALAGRHASGAGIRPFMPDQHRQFFASLPYLFIAVPDGHGWPIATMLTGPVGFVQAPTPGELHIRGLPLPSDPAAPGIAAGNEIGILGLDLATRRRNRANGRISGADPDGFSVAIAQSFGNCAQYIQTRSLRARARHGAGEECASIDGLDASARRLIAACDTSFVASRSRADAGPDGGLDVSHRGGRPGFVRVDGDSLFIPDFKGNRFFNTLGNFLGDPRAGLLFIDFETGDLLQAAGTVTIDWNPDDASVPSGAQRYWRVDIARSWRRRDALPFVWEFGGYAPTTLATGTWGRPEPGKRAERRY
jgi:predicted pyridoxine 5'-phosphate oxidase superfamily flavin-nucleotide-binding protein